MRRSPSDQQMWCGCAAPQRAPPCRSWHRRDENSAGSYYRSIGDPGCKNGLMAFGCSKVMVLRISGSLVPSPISRTRRERLRPRDWMMCEYIMYDECFPALSPPWPRNCAPSASAFESPTNADGTTSKTNRLFGNAASRWAAPCVPAAS